jgi:hypothetical protein
MRSVWDLLEAALPVLMSAGALVVMLVIKRR